MRRFARIFGGVLIAVGVLTLAWGLAIWRWQDPVTALYTHWQQQKLADSLDAELRAYRPTRSATRADPGTEGRLVASAAARFRREAKPGQPIGRIVIGRIGLDMVVVNGTDHETLKKGPGRDARSFMPGQNRLVYIAGHRTTYLAPFSHIDNIRTGDFIRLEMPYATFVYRAARHRVVDDSDMSVLQSPRHEQLELQACHPRFFSSHRWIVYGKLVSVQPRGMPAYRYEAAAISIASG